MNFDFYRLHFLEYDAPENGALEPFDQDLTFKRSKKWSSWPDFGPFTAPENGDLIRLPGGGGYLSWPLWFTQVAQDVQHPARHAASSLSCVTCVTHNTEAPA